MTEQVQAEQPWDVMVEVRRAGCQAMTPLYRQGHESLLAMNKIRVRRGYPKQTLNGSVLCDACYVKHQAEQDANARAWHDADVADWREFMALAATDVSEAWRRFAHKDEHWKTQAGSRLDHAREQSKRGKGGGGF